MMTKTSFRGVYIDGKWEAIDAHDGSFHTENPFSGEQVLEVHPAGVSHVESAVEAAHAAYLKWRALSHQQRAEYLLRLKEALSERKQDLALAITCEMGKLYSEALVEASACVGKSTSPWVRLQIEWPMCIRPASRVDFTPIGPMVSWRSSDPTISPFIWPTVTSSPR
ncbi:MAG TPA: aldehyde dehydrogenase [Phycisphaerales bacterium]|nr:aldehyde dehydrogenase [Phycisphaerales bacterium]